MLAARKSLCTSGVPGVPESSDNFGSGLASGDFGRNPGSRTVDDLAVVAGDDLLGGTELTGALLVLYGRTDGLTAQSSQRWNPVDLGFPRNGYGWFSKCPHTSWSTTKLRPLILGRATFLRAFGLRHFLSPGRSACAHGLVVAVFSSDAIAVVVRRRPRAGV